MSCQKNPYRASEKAIVISDEIPSPSVDVNGPNSLLARCPAHQETPLMAAEGLAQKAGVASLHIKDESHRMGLGSFKALGAAYVIAHHANEAGGDAFETALLGKTYVTASAGNHGMSVAAGAKIFGAKSVIFLSDTVPKSFGKRLEEKGAEVRFEGADYEASMEAAKRFAEDNGFTLLSDSSWEGYHELPHRLMEGYLVLIAETIDKMPEPPTHIFLQAGVGGMAGAVAALVRQAWGDGPVITVVEPDAAPALLESIKSGHCVFADGPVSNMGRLDCKEPSLIALKGLARDTDYFATISDGQAAEAVRLVAGEGISSTPSGTAGIAALMSNDIRKAVGIGSGSSVLCFVSEGPAE